MKPLHFLFLLALLMVLCSLPAKDVAAKDSTWVKKEAFPSSSRNFGLGFSLAGKGYYGLGQKQLKPFVYKTYNDLWEYDPEKNTWTQKAEFPGPGRLMTKGFTLENKIYVGFGYVIAAYGPNAGSNDHQTDFYEFDPGTNTWTQKSNTLLGRGEIFFSINNYLFSVNPEFRTLNRYTCKTDTWFENNWEKDEFSPSSSIFAGETSCFTIGNMEYFVATDRVKGNTVNQLWELDPNAITWKQKNDLPGEGSDSLFVFSHGKRIFVIRNGNQCLEYVSQTDTWIQTRDTKEEHKGFLPVFSIAENCYGFDQYEFWKFTP